MTNKVKPFFIRITDDMTPQIALEVKDKCTNKNVSGDFHFNPSDIKRWKYLGVCSQDGLCYSDFTENFYGNAQEITLDQLDEWLGISGGSPKQVEWKSGDKCKYLNSPVKHYFIGTNPLLESHCYIVSDDGYVNHVNVIDLSKPETPEQEAERERLEAACDRLLEENAKLLELVEFAFNEGAEEGFYGGGYFSMSKSQELLNQIKDKTNNK